MGQPEFDIACTVDGLFENSASIARPPGRKRRQFALTETVDTYQAIINGERQVCGFTFAPVKTNDDPSFMTADEEDLAIQETGKIVISLQRGRLWMKRKKQKDSAGPDPLPETCTRQDEVTKKVSKDNGKALFTKLVPLHAGRSQSSAQEWFWTAGKEEAEKEIKFVFYYTSKLYLQVQQIIPIISKSGLSSEPIVVNDDDATPPPPISLRNRPDAGGEDVAFTKSRPGPGIVDGVLIKEEPVDEDDSEPSEDLDSDMESERSATTGSGGMSDGTDGMLNAFDPQPDPDEDLYGSSVPPPRHVRGHSVLTDTYQMRGGLGDRSPRASEQQVEVATSSDIKPNAPHSALRNNHRSPASVKPPMPDRTRLGPVKRKAPQEIDAAEREVEEAELALLEIQAKKRLLAARTARDSLLPFREDEE